VSVKLNDVESPLLANVIGNAGPPDTPNPSAPSGVRLLIVIAMVGMDKFVNKIVIGVAATPSLTVPKCAGRGEITME
jgi:hypothetical protein